VILTDELAPEDASSAAFESVYSETPHINIDIDLDTFASKNHAKKIGLHYFPPTKDAPNFDTSPEALTRVVRAVLSEDEVAGLQKYPKALHDGLGSLARMAQKQEQREHPEKYSAAHMAKLPQKRKRSEDGDEEGDEEMEDAEPMHAAEFEFDSDVDDDSGDDELDDDDVAASPSRQNSFAGSAGSPPAQSESFVWTGFPAAASASPIPAQAANAVLQGYVARLNAYP